MPTVQNYNYRARNPKNEMQTGLVSAASLEDAKKILLANGLTPISITVPQSLTDLVPFLNKVSLREKSLFTRQLATMIEAGLSLSQALRLLLNQRKRGRLQSILETLQSDIQDGFSFSSALAKFPDVFDPIFVNVIRSGEATGKMDVVLLQLADNLEKESRLQGKIRGALFYPIFIIITMIGVGIIMMTKVVPQLVDVFQGNGQALPLSTRSLIALSNFLVHDWGWLLLALAAIALGLRSYMHSQSGVELFSRLNLRLPVVGGIVTQTSMARFARLLGILLGSGVPLLEALHLLDDSFTNEIYKRGLREVASQVERGIPMSVPITANPAFPAIVGQMVGVGEQTGKMDEVMDRLAAYFESEVDNRVSGLSSLIEPIVIVILGVAVFFLVEAILLPIYQISTSIS